MPPRTPTGIAINDAMPTMIPVPTIAWPIPAWDTTGHRGSHGGRSVLKRNCGWMTEGSPFGDGEPQHQPQRYQRQKSQHVHESQPGATHIGAPMIAVHTARLASRVDDWTRSNASMLTRNVTRIKTSPSSIRAAG